MSSHLSIILTVVFAIFVSGRLEAKPYLPQLELSHPDFAYNEMVKPTITFICWVESEMNCFLNPKWNVCSMLRIDIMAKHHWNEIIRMPRYLAISKSLKMKLAPPNRFRQWKRANWMLLNQHPNYCPRHSNILVISRVLSTKKVRPTTVSGTTHCFYLSIRQYLQQQKCFTILLW